MSHSIASVLPHPNGDRRTWVRRIVGGGRLVESCPPWCTADHTLDEVGMLDDLTHTGDETTLMVEVFGGWTAGQAVTVPAPFLSARVLIDPYSDDPRRRVPHVAFEPSQGEVMEGLTPDEFVAVIARFRTQLDRLEAGVHAQAVAALTAYNAEH